MRITDKARADFVRDGIVVLRGALSISAATHFRSASDSFGVRATKILAAASKGSLAQWAAENPQDLIVVPEAQDARQVCRFEYLIGHDPAFAARVEELLTPWIASVAGEACIPFKDKENEKHPGGGAFRPHQDFAAYQAFGPRYNVTAMITIDPARRANGCLEFARDWRAVVDAHRAMAAAWIEDRPLLRHYQGGPENGDIDRDVAAAFAWEFVETDPVDLVIFDSFAPHRSGPNQTGHSRRAMFLTFNRAREGDWYGRYYKDKRENFDDPKFHVSTPTVHGAAAAKM